MLLLLMITILPEFDFRRQLNYDGAAAGAFPIDTHNRNDNFQRQNKPWLGLHTDVSTFHPYPPVATRGWRRSTLSGSSWPRERRFFVRGQIHVIGLFNFVLVPLPNQKNMTATVCFFFLCRFDGDSETFCDCQKKFHEHGP